MIIKEKQQDYGMTTIEQDSIFDGMSVLEKVLARISLLGDNFTQLRLFFESSIFENRKQLVLDVIDNNCGMYAFLTLKHKKNIDIVRSYLKNSNSEVTSVPESVWLNNLDFTREYLTKSGVNLYLLPDEVRFNLEFIKISINASGAKVLVDFPVESRYTRSGDKFYVRDDKDILLFAIKRDVSAYIYASRRLMVDADVVSLLLDKLDGNVVLLKRLDEKKSILKKENRILLKMLERNPLYFMQSAPEKQWNFWSKWPELKQELAFQPQSFFENSFNGFVVVPAFDNDFEIFSEIVSHLDAPTAKRIIEDRADKSSVLDGKFNILKDHLLSLEVNAIERPKDSNLKKKPRKMVGLK